MNSLLTSICYLPLPLRQIAQLAADIGFNELLWAIEEDTACMNASHSKVAVYANLGRQDARMSLCDFSGPGAGAYYRRAGERLDFDVQAGPLGDEASALER